MRRAIWIICSCLALCLQISSLARSILTPTFYVATNGNDQWSGRIATPNAARDDGPFRTLQRARDALRNFKRANRNAALTVMVRGGAYFMSQPLVLTPNLCNMTGPFLRPLLVQESVFRAFSEPASSFQPHIRGNDC